MEKHNSNVTTKWIKINYCKRMSLANVLKPHKPHKPHKPQFQIGRRINRSFFKKLSGLKAMKRLVHRCWETFC